MQNALWENTRVFTLFWPEGGLGCKKKNGILKSTFAKSLKNLFKTILKTCWTTLYTFCNNCTIFAASGKKMRIFVFWEANFTENEIQVILSKTYLRKSQLKHANTLPICLLCCKLSVDTIFWVLHITFPDLWVCQHKFARRALESSSKSQNCCTCWCFLKNGEIFVFWQKVSKTCVRWCWQLAKPRFM